MDGALHIGLGQTPSKKGWVEEKITGYKSLVKSVCDSYFHNGDPARTIM